ncbi:hypothetical protein Tco_0478229 [Tanacetum coccineum]
MKRGRKISDIVADPTISLVQDEGMTWFQEDAQVQEKQSDDTEVLLEEEEPTELVEDQGSGEKGEKEVTTADIALNTASATISIARPIPDVSTAAGRIVYSRRSLEKRKDKGKAIMTEPEPEKKTKKQLQQERLGHEEAIRLQEQIDEDDQARDIDWSDPAVIRYHTLKHRPRSLAEVRKNMCIYLKNQGGYKMKHFKGMSYEDIRPIFEKVWDEIHSFVPMDSELELQRLKRGGQEEPTKKQVKEEIVQQEEDVAEQDVKESTEKAGRRKKSLARKRGRETLSEESAKKQKLEDDVEKKEL